MLVNNVENNTENHVEFISYTGSFPNLCRGTLTLCIDSEEVKFGHDAYSHRWNEKTGEQYYEGEENDKPHFDAFWSSGGSCGFDDKWNTHISIGEWIIDVTSIPEQYRKYAAEIDEVFNNNVDYGCCGGCI